MRSAFKEIPMEGMLLSAAALLGSHCVTYVCSRVSFNLVHLPCCLFPFPKVFGESVSQGMMETMKSRDNWPSDL